MGELGWELAHERLTDAIVNGSLRPGSLHSAASLAKQLGASRTPVREALFQLAGKEMVSFERGRGFRILETSAHQLEEIFQLRLWLEPPATRLAVRNLTAGDVAHLRNHLSSMLQAADANDEPAIWSHDRAFHRAILQASGNGRLAAFVDSLRELTLLRGAVTAMLLSQGLAVVAEHHRPILEAIEAGDAVRAAGAMREHIEHTSQLVETAPHDEGAARAEVSSGP
jgi:DNA-binding GntR family transcriptional regulator